MAGGGPWSNQVVSLIILTEQTTGFSGLFGYSPKVAAGDLIFALAAAPGTDPHGNAYSGPGLTVGPATGPQVQLGLNNSGAGIVRMDLNDSRFGFGEVNAEVIGSPNYASMGVIGPASTAVGHTDFVEEAFNSANAAGSSTANWQIFYVDPTGLANLMATVDANGFTFSGPAIFDNAVTFNNSVTFNAGATISGGLTVDTINGSNATGAGDNGGVTSGPSGTVNSFPAAGPNHTHSEFHHHPI